MTPVSVELFAYPWENLDAGEARFRDYCVLGDCRLEWFRKLACEARKVGE